MRCRHATVDVVYSPDDGGFYAECRDCWVAGPVKQTQLMARRAFYQVVKKVN